MSAEYYAAKYNADPGLRALMERVERECGPGGLDRCHGYLEDKRSSMGENATPLRTPNGYLTWLLRREIQEATD